MTEANQAGKTDLWGQPFLFDPADSAPVELLRQQADALTARTGGRVEGVVLKNFDKGKAWASLYAKVPSLQGYMYKMLTVAHPATANPADPLSMDAHDTFRGREDWEEVNSMAHFTSWLEEALSSDQAHAVIGNLLKYVPEHATT